MSTTQEPKSEIEKFFDDCTYKPQIAEAVTQEDRIGFFVQTQLQNTLYVQSETSINRLWNENNTFIGWIKSVMRKDNFVAYMKYFRHPLPTTTLIQDDILPELSKVLDAQNQYFSYNFSSIARETEANKFLKDKYATYYKDVIFDALINNHNSVVITDYNTPADPYRILINIRNIMAIEPDTDGNIKKIVFKGVDIKGNKRYFYYTDEFYSVYKEIPPEERSQTGKYQLVKKKAHKLKACPADFISQKPLNSKLFVVRKSIFSNFIEKLENYVNYYLLQKMFVPHGALPVITYYKQNKGKCKASWEDGTFCSGGWLATSKGLLGNRDEKVPCPVCNENTIITAGSVIKLPIPKFDDRTGSKPFDLNANFVKFHHAPVALQKWFDEFVEKKREEIRTELVGKALEKENSQAKNVEQIKAGNRILENTLLYFSNQLSSLRKILDAKLLTIKFKDAYQGSIITFGTEFYLETESELRMMLNSASDPITKDNIKTRINFAVYKNNPDLLARNDILNKLLPYSTTKDSEMSALVDRIDPVEFELRMNFTWYIDSFEAEYADLVIFINDTFSKEAKMSAKLNIIRTILYNMAKKRAIKIKPASENN